MHRVFMHGFGFASGFGSACMVLDLLPWFWNCMHGSGFSCMILDLLAQYSQKYLFLGPIPGKSVMTQYWGSPFRHDEAKALK